MSKKLSHYIPNLLTLTNSLSGAIGTALTLQGNLRAAAICLVISLIADFFDGFTARKLEAYSPLGKDLDSLADAISFGVLPASMVYNEVALLSPIGSYLAYLIVPASVYRLAKFNHDERQNHSFIGLPTPSNAIFWLGLAWFLRDQMEQLRSLSDSTVTLIVSGIITLVILFSYLLVSEIPMFSLKGGSFGWRDSWRLYLTVIVGLVCVGTWGVPGLAITIGFYVLVNLISRRA